TLSPRHPLYRGSQEGTPEERDFASKNGSVWPWLLSFYVRACFDIDGDSFLPQAEEILANFEEDIQSYGIGSIGELYDADPPYAARGAISQAWSVGAVLEIYHMVLTRRPAPEKTKGSATRKTAAKAGKTTEKAAKTPGKPAKDTAAKAATAGKSTAKSGKKAAEPAAGKARKATAPSGGTKKKTMK
ncbi:amylo-alpha-1,6-glucosidase, partial [uncultured Alistipes sp.]|uniref:amylo-alpha-1,6-glucosidase n=1 Tax=uncultured Alistipes sp. TaxID=538949 RepID=UPI0026658207